MTEPRIDLSWEGLQVVLFPEKTRRWMATLPPSADPSPALGYFHRLFPRADAAAQALLSRFGIDPERIFHARPLAPPDERGEVLYLAVTRLTGRVLCGGEERPRRSVESEGLSLIFVSDPSDFTPSLPSAPEPQTELRFVIPLPWDPDGVS